MSCSSCRCKFPYPCFTGSKRIHGGQALNIEMELVGGSASHLKGNSGRTGVSAGSGRVSIKGGIASNGAMG